MADASNLVEFDLIATVSVDPNAPATSVKILKLAQPDEALADALKEARLAYRHAEIAINKERAANERADKALNKEKLATERADNALKGVWDKDAVVGDANNKERLATERADNMMARAGRNYVKRDVAQTIVGATFPNGEDFLMGFKEAFVNFDTFITDAVSVVEDTGVSAAAAAHQAVREVLVPLHTACETYVATQLNAKKAELVAFGVTLPDYPENQPDNLDSVFWFAHMQPIFLAQVEALTDQEVEKLLSPRALEVHDLMVLATEKGTIEESEGTMRLPPLARHLLRSLAIAALSVPRCFLYPAPGQLVKYKEGLVKEVLSPGTKKHGRIKEGDQVEVVFSGLYFDQPTAENFSIIKASEQPLVRRIPQDAVPNS